MLNEKEANWILANELSENQALEVRSLVDRLGMSIAKKARMAPSIIVRSELELFGSSSPRFAYRLYFNESPGFINLRRLKEIRLRVSNAETKSELTRQEVMKIFESPNQSCIADCLLPRPRRMWHDGYHLIQAVLSDGYGESFPRLGFPNYPATPYVKNITLGGGLCTQACCFQSAVLLNEFITGIHGLAEITAMSHSVRRRTLSISGMDIRLMRRYFQSISLSLTEQVPHFEAIQRPNPNESKLEFEAGLKAYCLSGMPIIIPVDLGRMVGFQSRNPKATPDTSRCIYARNKIDVEYPKFDHRHATRHCVVIVGCEKHSRLSGETKFVFNDPGGFPFMFAKTAELIEAGPYVGTSENDIEQFRFWPVTPTAVKMPLLDFLLPGEFKYREGLRSLARYYRSALHIAERFPPSFNFLLLRLREVPSLKYLSPVRSTRALPNAQHAFRDKLTELSKILQDSYSWSKGHWIWLELMEEAIWIWDAESEPDCNDPPESLIATIVRNGNQLSFNWPNDFEISE